MSDRGTRADNALLFGEGVLEESEECYVYVGGAELSGGLKRSGRG